MASSFYLKIPKICIISCATKMQTTNYVVHKQSYFDIFSIFDYNISKIYLVGQNIKTLRKYSFQWKDSTEIFKKAINLMILFTLKLIRMSTLNIMYLFGFNNRASFFQIKNRKKASELHIVIFYNS
jgi:hypothetical protein